MPLEHLPLEPTYLPYLTSTHIVPLQTIQALLPLLRSSPSRAHGALSNGIGRQTIIVCLPVTDTRVGLPFAGAQAMSASATLQGLQVLRREIKIASLSMVNPEAMKNIRVVTVEVGTVDTDGHNLHHHQGAPGSGDVQPSTEGWSTSEKSVYGRSFLTVSGGNMQVRKSRKPAPVSHFVRTILNVVNGRSFGDGTNTPFVVSVFYKVRSWVRGDRIAVGAGGEQSMIYGLRWSFLTVFFIQAGTYVLASSLPSSILDALINLPHFLISVRNGLLPITPARTIDQLPPPVGQQQNTVAKTQGPAAPPPPAQVQPAATVPAEAQDDEPSSGDEKQSNSSNNDDADVEGNTGDAPAVENSWVNLRESHD